MHYYSLFYIIKRGNIQEVATHAIYHGPDQMTDDTMRQYVKTFMTHPPKDNIAVSIFDLHEIDTDTHSLIKSVYIAPRPEQPFFVPAPEDLK